jgi:hypothetical protein
MAIPHPANDERSLFHLVDHLRFNRSTVVFTCMPAVEAEARNMVSCLLTYLNHLHGDVINEFFTKDAQLCADGSYWDDVDQCICNEDDEHVSSLLDDVDDDYILPPVNKNGKHRTLRLWQDRHLPARPSRHLSNGKPSGRVKTPSAPSARLKHLTWSSCQAPSSQSQ